MHAVICQTSEVSISVFACFSGEKQEKREGMKRCGPFLRLILQSLESHTSSGGKRRRCARSPHSASTQPQQGLTSRLPGKALSRTAPNKRPLLQTDSYFFFFIPQCPKVFAEVNLPKSCQEGREGVPIIPKKKVVGEKRCHMTAGNVSMFVQTRHLLSLSAQTRISFDFFFFLSVRE